MSSSLGTMARAPTRVVCGVSIAIFVTIYMAQRLRVCLCSIRT